MANVNQKYFAAANYAGSCISKTYGVFIEKYLGIGQQCPFQEISVASARNQPVQPSIALFKVYSSSTIGEN